jgi:transcriptional regulator with XRE-family HTH domain
MQKAAPTGGLLVRTISPTPEASSAVQLTKLARQIADHIAANQLDKHRDRAHGRRARPALLTRRRELGFRQCDLADLAGVTQGMIQAIESGRSLARPALVAAFTIALESSEDELFEPARFPAGFHPLRVAQAELDLSKVQCQGLIERFNVPTTTGHGRATLVDVQALMRAKNRTRKQCPGCKKPAPPGLKWHAPCAARANAVKAHKGMLQRWKELRTDPEELARFIAERAAKNLRWQGHERSQPDLLVVRCFACGEQIERPRRFAERAAAERRRQFCPDVCWPIWHEALLRACRAAARWSAPKDIDAFRAALAVGEELDERLKEIRPMKFGQRRRAFAVPLVVEALFVERRLSGAEIVRLLRREGVALVNERYVERLRHEASIWRRSKGA